MHDQEKNILQAIADHLSLTPEDLDRGSLLRDELNLGPIELNDLLLALSQKFDVIFHPEEIENVKTVGDLIVAIEDNLIG